MSLAPVYNTVNTELVQAFFYFRYGKTGGAKQKRGLAKGGWSNHAERKTPEISGSLRATDLFSASFGSRFSLPGTGCRTHELQYPRCLRLQLSLTLPGCAASCRVHQYPGNRCGCPLQHILIMVAGIQLEDGWYIMLSAPALNSFQGRLLRSKILVIRVVFLFGAGQEDAFRQCRNRLLQKPVSKAGKPQGRGRCRNPAEIRCPTHNPQGKETSQGIPCKNPRARLPQTPLRRNTGR